MSARLSAGAFRLGPAVRFPTSMLRARRRLSRAAMNWPSATVAGGCGRPRRCARSPRMEARSTAQIGSAIECPHAGVGRRAQFPGTVTAGEAAVGAIVFLYDNDSTAPIAITTIGSGAFGRAFRLNSGVPDLHQDRRRTDSGGDLRSRRHLARGERRPR
jgi:hypothetical protein